MADFPPRAGTPQRLSASSIDTIFKLLSHSYRRYTLISLQEHRTMALDDLADGVASRAQDKPLMRFQRKSLNGCFRAFHTQIPRLEAAHLVDYDPSDVTAAIRDAAEQTVPYLLLVINVTKLI